MLFSKTIFEKNVPFGTACGLFAQMPKGVFWQTEFAPAFLGDDRAGSIKIANGQWNTWFRQKARRPLLWMIIENIPLTSGHTFFKRLASVYIPRLKTGISDIDVGRKPILFL